MTGNGSGPVLVRDGRAGDVEAMGWAASEGQRAEWRTQLRRGLDGEVDFLVAEVDARIVGKVVLDPAFREGGVAWAWMASVDPGFRSQGIGTAVLPVLEQRAMLRGCTALEMSVDDDNPRARALYERQGYRVVGPYVDSHDEVDDAGIVTRVESPGVLLRKELGQAAVAGRGRD